MADEYDVFGQLNDLCKNNTLEKLKSTLAPTNAEDAMDDDNLDLGLEEVLSFTSSRRSRRKKATPRRPSPSLSPSLIGSLSPRKRTAAATKKAGAKKTAAAKQGDETEAVPVEPTPTEAAASRPRTRNSLKAPAAAAQLEAAATAAAAAAAAAAAVAQWEAAVTAAASTLVARSTRGRGRKKNANTQAAQTANAVVDIAAPPVVPTPVPLLQQQSLPMVRGRRGRGGRAVARNVASSRRAYMAELAARCTNVDYVDLVTAPVPRIEGVVNVDSDDDDVATTTQSTATESTNADVNLSFVDDNPEISVKVTWKSRPEVFQLRKHQKFAHIFKTLAERENTDIENIVCNLENRLIMSTDTPASIDYKIYQFISGRVWEKQYGSPPTGLKKKRDANNIRLKIQADQWKRPLQLDLLKTDKFKILYIKCAEELNMPLEKLKLSFDGELLEHNGTPADFDLEGGEAIDLRIKK